MVDAREDQEVKYTVPIFYGHLKALPSIGCTWHSGMLQTARTATDTSMPVNTVDVRTEAAEQKIVVEDYRGIHDAAAQIEHAGDLLRETCHGMPSYWIS